MATREDLDGLRRELEGAIADLRIGLGRIDRLIKDVDLPDDALNSIEAAFVMIADEVIGGHLHVAGVAIEQAQRDARS